MLPFIDVLCTTATLLSLLLIFTSSATVDKHRGHSKTQILDKEFDVGSYLVFTEDLFNTGSPVIITGSLSGSIKLYSSNPTTRQYSFNTIIGHVSGLVHADTVDVNNDGFKDIIVSYKFGGCPANCREEDGLLGWFENPGIPLKQWEFHYIGKPINPAHRVVVLDNMIVLVPVNGVGEPKGDTFSKPMVISAFDMRTWEQHTITNKLNLCHEAKRVDDYILLGCHQGAFKLSMQPKTQKNASWVLEFLGYQAYENLVHAGFSSVAVGNYPEPGLVFNGPFHGRNVGIIQGGVTRIIEEFPEGSESHDIRSVDLDGDGIDEIITAFRKGDQGIFIYWLQSDGQWLRERIFNGPVSTICIDDFDGDGQADIASIDWGELGSSVVAIHYNRYVQ